MIVCQPGSEKRTLWLSVKSGLERPSQDGAPLSGAPSPFASHVCRQYQRYVSASPMLM